MSEPLRCINHPNVETYLRCNRCGAPICPKCAVRTEVGYRCRNCINQQQKIFYADFRPVHYLIAALVAFPLGLVGGALIPALGWFAIFLGPLAGIGIAEAVRWAIRRRRGPHTWLVVAACILVADGPWLLLAFFPALLTSSEPASLFAVWPLLWHIVYLIGAISAAVARLRTRRRP